MAAMQFIVQLENGTDTIQYADRERSNSVSTIRKPSQPVKIAPMRLVGQVKRKMAQIQNQVVGQGGEAEFRVQPLGWVFEAAA